MSEHSTREDEVDAAVDRIVDLGKPRLHRTFPQQVLTGGVAGGELGFGILAMLVVEHETGNHLLAALAFSIGLLALQLGHSELFTEGFLVPVATVAAKEGTVSQLFRLWAGTFAGNLVGGWVAMLLIVTGLPELHGLLIRRGEEFASTSVGWGPLALAVLAGAALTLMTRMHNGTEDETARTVATVAIAFVVAGTGVLHSVLDGLLLFGAILTGQGSVSYLDWLRFEWWVVPANMAGGILLVTATRLVRSKEKLQEKSQAASHDDA